MKPIPNKQCFRDILAGSASRNSRALMNRARQANRIAKMLTSPARGRAYSVKHNALAALVRSFPDQVRVARDPVFRNWLLLS